MLDLKLQDKIPCSEIRKRTKITDVIEYTLKQKWKWAGHIARRKDNRWTKRCRVATKEQEEIKKTTKQKMARRHDRGGNHLEQESNRQTGMEDTDGGLHPTVDGQSPDEDDEDETLGCNSSYTLIVAHLTMLLSMWSLTSATVTRKTGQLVNIHTCVHALCA